MSLVNWVSLVTRKETRFRNAMLSGTDPGIICQDTIDRRRGFTNGKEWQGSTGVGNRTVGRNDGGMNNGGQGFGALTAKLVRSSCLGPHQTAGPTTYVGDRDVSYQL